ncbi:hypothetical protein THRCLA_22340, partial [Thraustotheca clavata]
TAQALELLYYKPAFWTCSTVPCSYYAEYFRSRCGSIFSLPTAKYTRCLFVGLHFVHVYELLEKTLLAQNVAFSMIYCNIVCNIVDAIVGYSLIHYYDMGLLGVAIGRTITNISLPLCFDSILLEKC